MKQEILILALLVFTGLPGFCGDTYWYQGNRTMFLHNKNLSLFSKTYKHNGLKYYGCFGYFNSENAKFQGKVFASESACISFDYGNYTLGVDKVYFHFKDIKNPVHISGSAHYFSNTNILRDVMLALPVAGDGWLNN